MIRTDKGIWVSIEALLGAAARGIWVSGYRSLLRRATPRTEISSAACHGVSGQKKKAAISRPRAPSAGESAACALFSTPGTISPRPRSVARIARRATSSPFMRMPTSAAAREKAGDVSMPDAAAKSDVVAPGHTHVTETPAGRTSSRSAPANERTYDLLAAYAAPPGIGTADVSDETRRTRPRPPRTKSAAKSWHTCVVESTLSSSIERTRARGAATASPSIPQPALATSSETEPGAASRRRSTNFASVKQPAQTRVATACSASISAASFCSSGARRAVRTTL